MSVLEAEPTSDGKVPRRRKGITAFVFVAAAILLMIGGVITLLFLPAPTGYQTFVSPPIDASGMRVKMKIPAGWSEVTPPMLKRQNGLQTFILSPPDKLPAWLTRFARPSWVQGEPVILAIDVRAVSLHSAHSHNTSVIVDHSSDQSTHTAIGSAESLDGKYEAYITYVRTDKAAFERSLKAVMESVRIER